MHAWTYSCSPVVPSEAMRNLVALGVVCALMLSAPSAASRQTARGPFLLVSLPALGTVTWRCDPAMKPGVAPNLPGMALGFRAFVNSATDHIRLHVRGRTITRRVVQPGDSIDLPYVRSRVQHLDLVQQTGAGTLRAFVTVDFVPHGPTTYCYRYLPPRIDVSVKPRS